jgi:formamidopyrimidine-DNA glycosylase
VPELPQMRALSERLDPVLHGKLLEGYELLGFTGLKTVEPRPDELIGSALQSVSYRGKFMVMSFGGPRILVHLSQAGRVDVEEPPKKTRPKGAVVRLIFSGATGLLVREHGTQRKAGWWVLADGDEGPMATLGPEPDSPEFEALLLEGQSPRQLHTLLRDQRVVSGIGRGYADDALNRAGLSPFASLTSLDAEGRARLVGAVRSVLAEGLAKERQRTGGLSDAKLGTNFIVHNHAGQPCPICAETLLKVSFDSHEIVYCKHCQTKGRALADRRLSKLLR